VTGAVMCLPAGQHIQQFGRLRSIAMTWSIRFLAFFDEIASQLAVVLNAEGCREGWLQGEFYRHFRTPENGFRVNCSYGGSRTKHDLFCERPIQMAAELKVYGLSGYYTKNLCGQSNISQFLPGTDEARRFLSLDEIERLEPAAGSYLADVLRLRRLPESLERYMILVLQKANEPDGFGRAISAIQVSSQESEWQCADFLVRVSQV
jgi:hypothetical protein